MIERKSQTVNKESNAEICIRYARRDELDRVNIIRSQVNDLHVDGRPDIFRPGFCDELKNHIYEKFDSEDSDVIAALEDDEIVGFATVEYIKRPESAYCLARSIYRIEEFGVDVNHQRKGIGRKLIAFIGEVAKQKGFDRVDLDMWQFNETALNFYEEIGFATYRRYMEWKL